MKVKRLNFTKPEASLCFPVESGKYLLKMGKGGVIERVISAVSAAPIVVVCRKGNEDVCVCGDFSVTHSAYADVETYPRPQIEDMHSALTGQISTKNESLTLVMRLTEKAYILLRINLPPFVMPLDLRMSQP